MLFVPIAIQMILALIHRYYFDKKWPKFNLNGKSAKMNDYTM